MTHVCRLAGARSLGASAGQPRWPPAQHLTPSAWPPLVLCPLTAPSLGVSACARLPSSPFLGISEYTLAQSQPQPYSNSSPS